MINFNLIDRVTQTFTEFSDEIEKLIDKFWNNISDINSIEKITLGRKIKNFSSITHLKPFLVKAEFEGFNKFEDDNYLSRKNLFPLPFGMCYGEIVNTLAPDNDPIDVIILQPYHTQNIVGYHVECIAVTMFKMFDDDEEDNKLFCIPLTDLYYFATLGKNTIYSRIFDFTSYTFYNVYKSYKNIRMTGFEDCLITQEYIAKYTI